MIRGKRIHLRTIRASELDDLYQIITDLSLRGDFYPLTFTSEAQFKKEFQETGFWCDSFGRLLICTDDGRVVGGIWYFTTAKYIDGYELGSELLTYPTNNCPISVGLRPGKFSCSFPGISLLFCSAPNRDRLQLDYGVEMTEVLS